MLRKAISLSATGELVAAIAGRRIRVLGYLMVAAGAVTVKFQSASTDLTGAMTLATGVPNTAMGGNSLDVIPDVETAHGEALNLTLSGAVQVSGWLLYDVVV